jgi:hypothetical protein
LHPLNKPTSLETFELLLGEVRCNIFELWEGYFMANQQGKKTHSGNPETASGSILGLDQDVPQVKAGTATGGSPASPSSTQPLSEKVSSTTSDILEKAKETASGTYDAVATQATTKIEERKGELSSGLKTLADTFRKTGTDLQATQSATPLTDITARYSGNAANQIERIADYFERKDLRAMMRDAENFARRNPAIFLGAAFGLGLVAARFLKSSPPSSERSTGMENPGAGLPTALPPSTDRPNPMPTNP